MQKFIDGDDAQEERRNRPGKVSVTLLFISSYFGHLLHTYLTSRFPLVPRYFHACHQRTTDRIKQYLQLLKKTEFTKKRRHVDVETKTAKMVPCFYVITYEAKSTNQLLLTLIILGFLACCMFPVRPKGTPYGTAPSKHQNHHISQFNPDANQNVTAP